VPNSYAPTIPTYIDHCFGTLAATRNPHPLTMKDQPTAPLFTESVGFKCSFLPMHATVRAQAVHNQVAVLMPALALQGGGEGGAATSEN
jgi:hypothetical protein